MKQHFDQKKGNPTSFEVPDHILNMIPKLAEAYIKDSFDRAFAAANGMSKEDLEQNSTHNVVNSPERRQLHRGILLELIERGLKGEKPEKPLFIYFCGPMAAGKTNLRNRFDQRIKDENNDVKVSAFQDSALESVYQKYKQAASYQVYSDFNLYKERLPEYKKFKNNFGVVRAEASAVDQAAIAWSKELKSSLVLEQLGDGPKEKWASEMAEKYEFIAVGVIADPSVNAQGMRERSEDSGQEISEDELAGTVQKFSRSDAFQTTALHADKAVLLQSDKDYGVVCAWENGTKNINDPTAFQTFQSYADMDKDALMKMVQKNEGVTKAVTPTSIPEEPGSN
ncbi:MAG: hypothetical protein KTR28_03210 [Micavibrio sp.]|nr:hypothetical protein [Micavibrio sp.]